MRVHLSTSVGWIGLLLLAAVSLGCHGHEHEGEPTGATCPQGSTLTYASFGQTFMQTYCLRCHSASVTGAARMNAPADHNFDNQGQIQGLADHIDEHAGSGPDATNTAMPPGDPRPSMAERSQLSEWLACGAP
jgi:uncharacterized membrane protein